MRLGCEWAQCPNIAVVLVCTRHLVTADDGIRVRSEEKVTPVCPFHVVPVAAQGLPFATAWRPIGL